MKDKETKDTGRDVFISYAFDKGDSHASRDRQTADRVYEALEAEGIRCWAAHRDILPGDDWLNSIIAAIGKSKVLVLVFSANANNSKWVKDEVTMALDENIKIIPFRIDDVSPRGGLKILKYRCQWLDAFTPPMEEHIEKLVNVVCRHLGKEPKIAKKSKVDINKQAEPPKKEMLEAVNSVKAKAPPNWKWILAAAAIIFLVVIGIFIKDKIINKLEEVPEDVMKIQAKIGKEKVYINNSSYWEADYGDGIKMVYIPAGEFTMGSDKGDYDEYPEHKVYLDGYWMGKTEVTVGQFRKFVEENRYITEAEMDGLAYTWTSDKWEPKEGITWKNPGFIQDDNYPVVCISWNDAVEYCKWISEKKGINFKLPTEAQWEKAARGSTGIEYPWGDHEPYYKGEWYANYAAHDSWEKRGEDGFGFTAPVGSYPQGAPSYGLLDMGGNVWEWCYDRYGIYSNGYNKNPKGPVRGIYHVIRGGGWGLGARYLRCANRSYGGRFGRGNDVGFRLCQDNRGIVE
jgi:formylglycine-generating enzyme required for sulfatase activity